MEPFNVTEYNNFLIARDKLLAIKTCCSAKHIFDRYRQRYNQMQHEYSTDDVAETKRHACSPFFNDVRGVAVNPHDWSDPRCSIGYATHCWKTQLLCQPSTSRRGIMPKAKIRG